MNGSVVSVPQFTVATIAAKCSPFSCSSARRTLKYRDNESRRSGWLSPALASPARHHRVPAHGRAAVRRTRRSRCPRSRRRWRATSSSCSRRSDAPRPTTPPRTTSSRSARSVTSSSCCACPKGPVKVLVEGRARAQIRTSRRLEPFFVCDVEDIEEPDDDAVELAGADALGPGRVRGLRQAQHAHPARDARLGAHHRGAGPAGRHDRRPRRAQAEGQAGAARDRRRPPSGSSGSAS